MTAAPMLHVLSCDDCGDAHVQLREIARNGYGGEIICAACFPNSPEAANCDFTDFDVAQESSE